MKTEIKKKEQAMMCAEDLKINNTNIKLNNVKNKKLNSKETRKTSGITLIALVVTIVVLLILAGITISLVFSENGIIAKAKEAAEKTNQAAINEQKQMNEVAGYLDNMLNEIGGSGEEQNPPEPTLPSDGSYSEKKGVNTPNLGEGMTPIKWDETKNDWVETNGSDPEWYNYGETESTRKWANAKTSDGSMWVWIPRYAYSITSGYHSSSTGNIEVEFMKGLTNETSTGRKSFDNVSGQGKWNIHPAFNYGQTVSGIWVAKFETSRSNATNSNAGSNNTIKIQPGVSSWRNISVNDIYTNCLNYNKTLNSHMMKNDEWGAVAYLSKSKYGKQNKEVWINNSSNFITGSAGNSTNANADTGTTNDYTSAQGVKASTTGTVHGVYDMSGGAWEYIAAYVNNGHDNLTKHGASLANSNDAKTKNVYSTGSSDSYENNYNANSGKYGDVVYETSENGNASNSSWYDDYSYFPNRSSPFFSRGGCYNSDASAGVFCFYRNYGDSDSLFSFRPVLVAL